MTKDRFEQLAETWGGDIARWPAGDRDAAALLMAAEPAFAAEVLARAGALDAALDGLALRPASVALTEAIVASAPQARGRAGWRGWLLPAGLTASLTAACVAGLLAGAALSRQAAGDAGAGAGTQASAAQELDASGLASEDV